MRKTSRLLMVAGSAALLLGLLSAESSAQSSHWFYGNYGRYDGMTWGVFPPPPPPPAYPPAAGQYQDPYADPAPPNRPPRQRHAYQPPGLDPAIEAEPGFEPGMKPPAAQSMAPKKPKSGTAALGAESDDVTTASTGAAPSGQGAVSCDKARGIVADFGFKDIKADSCSGKTYGFSATRDGKPFLIKIVASNGELAEVRRQ